MSPTRTGTPKVIVLSRHDRLGQAERLSFKIEVDLQGQMLARCGSGAQWWGLNHTEIIDGRRDRPVGECRSATSGSQ